MTARLEDLRPDAQVNGLVGREAVRSITAQRMGEAARVVDCDKEAELEIVSGGRRWRLNRAVAKRSGCPETTTWRSLNAHA